MKFSFYLETEVLNLVVDEDYIYKQDGKIYRLRKDISKGGWYLTSPFDKHPQTLLYTYDQMEEALKADFTKVS